MFHRYRPSGPKGPSEFEPQGSHLNNRSKFHKLFSTINTINIMTYCIIICDLLVHFWQLEIRSKNYLITDLLFSGSYQTKCGTFFLLFQHQCPILWFFRAWKFQTQISRLLFSGPVGTRSNACSTGQYLTWIEIKNRFWILKTPKCDFTKEQKTKFQNPTITIQRNNWFNFVQEVTYVISPQASTMYQCS